MPTQEVQFVGYRKGISEKNQKPYFRLNFRFTNPVISKDGMTAFFNEVSIFLPNEQEFLNYIKNHDLLSVIKLNTQIYGDKVKYSL